MVDLVHIPAVTNKRYDKSKLYRDNPRALLLHAINPRPPALPVETLLFFFFSW